MSETISIANLPTWTPSTDDVLVFVDRADWVTKRADISELPSSWTGDMLASTYDPAWIAQQVVGTTATQTISNKTLVAPALGTPASWTLTNCIDLPLAGIVDINTNRILGRSTAGTGDIEELNVTAIPALIGLWTSDSPQFAGVNVWHATDTTITRVSAGVIAVEGNNVLTTVAWTSVSTSALKSATTTVNISSATAPTTGQVLTATSSTAATWQTPSSWWIWTTWFSVNLTADQTITSANTIIGFNNEEFDDWSNFNTGTYKYTAPTTGKYEIWYALFINSWIVSWDLIYSIMYKNWSTAMIYNYQRAGWAELSLASSRFFSLTAWDTIELKIANWTASRWNLSWTLSWIYWYKLA